MLCAGIFIYGSLQIENMTTNMIAHISKMTHLVLNSGRFHHHLRPGTVTVEFCRTSRTSVLAQNDREDCAVSGRMAGRLARLCVLRESSERNGSGGELGLLYVADGRVGTDILLVLLGRLLLLVSWSEMCATTGVFGSLLCESREFVDWETD